MAYQGRELLTGESRDRRYEEILKELRIMKAKDFTFSGGRVLGSMYTDPHDISKRAHEMFFEENLGNPGLYPGTCEMQDEIIRMLGEMLHCPGVSGYLGSGGTEANITALWIARNHTRKTEVIFPKSAHFSFEKACDLLRLEPIYIDLDSDYRMIPDSVEDHLSEDTAAVVGVAGTTELGAVDPIDRLSELCRGKYFLHADAAFGGFVIPFLKDLGYPVPEFDFSLPGVSSMTIDPHKMGFSTIPSGVLLLREKELWKSIEVESPYLTSDSQSSLTSTKCSAGVASTYAVMKYLGMDGYKEMVKRCMETTEYFVSRLNDMALGVVTRPVMNIVGVELKDPIKVYQELDRMDWKTSLSKNPSCLRIVVMPHVTRNVIDEFMVDMEKTCRHLGEI